MLKGLCGTFNENQRDDLRTLEGDIEESVPAFANGWKTSETCQDADDLGQPPHPCDVNPHHRAKAQKACSKIRDALFQCKPTVIYHLLKILSNKDESCSVKFERQFHFTPEDVMERESKSK